MLALLSSAMRRRRSVLGILLRHRRCSAADRSRRRTSAAPPSSSGLPAWTGAARRVADWDASPVRGDGSGRLPWRDGTLAVAALLPAVRQRPRVLLVPGVHAAGIDEPRLVGFAREIAAAGHEVFTRAARRSRALHDHHAHDRHDRGCGALGVEQRGRPRHRRPDRHRSASASAAASRSSRPGVRRCRDGVACVMAFGGHADLPRTLRVPVHGRPAGRRRRARRTTTAWRSSCSASPIASSRADAGRSRCAPPSCRISKRRASTWSTRRRPAVEFARAKTLAAALDEPSRTYMNYVNARDVDAPGTACCCRTCRSRRRSRAVAGAIAAARRRRSTCSTARTTTSSPPIESTLLARDLRARRRAGARAADAAHHARGSGSRLDRRRRSGG